MKRRRLLLPGLLTLCILLLGSILIAATADSWLKAGRSDSSTDRLSVSGDTSVPSGKGYSANGSGSSKALQVYYFDVGQADAILIRLPNGKTLGIDAGEKDTQEDLVKSIQTMGISKIDIMFVTHPHSDPIGGMTYLLGRLAVGKIYMTQASTTTQTFENLLLAIANRKIPVVEAKAGVTLSLDPEVTVKILAPVTLSKDELNNHSIVLRISYGTTSFLFMGDAETPVEKGLLLSGEILASDVVKIGHHGSESSSSAAFLNVVLPHYAVISVGKDNDYNHPSNTVLERLAKVKAQVLRTDLRGTIVLSSDGSEVRILQ